MAASAWYENKRDGLGLEFLAEIDRCVALIANNPLPWPILEGRVRYININRFPYRIFFQTESRRIVILAVFHNQRDPAVLMQRLH